MQGAENRSADFTWSKSSVAQSRGEPRDVSCANRIIQSDLFSMQFFQDLAVFACLMCSASSAVRPHCMVNDTSSRKLGDFARRHQRHTNLVKAEKDDILTVQTLHSSAPNATGEQEV